MVGCAIVGVEAGAFWRLRTLLRRFHKRKLLSSPSMLYDLPSVSVCIPARNEKHAMTRCLEAVLASDYKKLEVVVLDDESVDNTSSLIRSFAKDGVRFVEGSTPPAGWLGKNYALRRLLDEASGTYVLFLDVDTILSPYSIGQIVSFAETTQANMISVLPQRSDLWRPSVVFAPLRYFWSVLLHRSSQPVAASNAWMVRRKLLQQDFDGFDSLRASVEPEVTIAAHYALTHSYKFLTSKQLLGVSYEKKMSSQVETIIRLRFPQLGYSIRKTFFASIAMYIVVFAPISILIFAPAWYLLAAVLYVGTAVCYYTYLQFTWKNGAVFGMWLWPVILLHEAWLTLVSMIRYKTKHITWKGRPLTTPDQ